MNHDITESKKKIIEAMKQTVTDFFYFTDDESSVLNVEYLLTVNVAKKLIELNKGGFGPYRVYLEHPTKILERECLPSVIERPMPRSRFTRSEMRNYSPYISRAGRVDVCVYKEENIYKHPIILVEVKGFNPPLSKIKEDMIRIFQFMNATCNTGSSLLKNAFLISLYNYTNISNDEAENRKLDEKREQIKSLIDNLEKEDVCYDITIFSITNGRASEEIINNYFDLGISEYISDSFMNHLFIGVMIYFYK
ncbi:hypothetical protein L7842_005000 [Providencia rettgeri]|uniref:hypothetical protein n=1 Tax=Providencia rettgeri TaxID=587 RepID=UPI001EE702A8|nr:hypothetical protein [Providencia rettgeri]MCG5290846.1 hypothetical protein [Providencia rettgeri]